MALDDLDYSNSIVNLDAKVSPQILAGILGINVSLLYQEAQIGRLPSVLIESTYRECIQMYLKHFKKSVDLKVEQARIEADLKREKLAADIKFKEDKIRIQAEAASKRRTGGIEGVIDEGMPPLMAAKVKQDIRLGQAKEAQLWLKIAIERKEFISVGELFELCEPTVGAIKNVLTTLSADFPEAKPAVNQALESLYSLGVRMVEKSVADSADYIQRMLDKDIDLATIEVDFTRDKAEL